MNENIETTQPELFDFDPVVDDVKLGYTKPKKYTRTTTDKELKEIRKNNLNQKADKRFFENGTEDQKIRRIITDIRPANQIVNYIPKTTARVINGIKIESSNKVDADNFMEHGSQIKEHITDENTKINAINICEQWKMTSYKGVIADLCGGLIKQISCGERFEGIEPVYFTDEKTGENVLSKWLVHMTYPQIRSCTFGGLVDEHGNIRQGYAEILRQTTEKDLQQFIKGDVATPRLLFFNKTEKLFGEYQPILINTVTSNEIIFELDRRYFPFDYTDKGEPIRIDAGNRFLVNIAGVSSILEVGHHYLLKQGVENLPSTFVANRYYQSLLGAFQFQSLLGIHLRNTKTDKDNIRLNKDGIFDLFSETQTPMNQEELKAWKYEHRTEETILIEKETQTDFFPKDVKKRQWGNVQLKAQLCAETLIRGLKETNILEELKKDPQANKILIPSNETKMQYLSEYKNALLAKVIPVSKINPTI